MQVLETRTALFELGSTTPGDWQSRECMSGSLPRMTRSDCCGAKQEGPKLTHAEFNVRVTSRVLFAICRRTTPESLVNSCLVTLLSQGAACPANTNFTPRTGLLQAARLTARTTRRQAGVAQRKKGPKLTHAEFNVRRTVSDKQILDIGRRTTPENLVSALKPPPMSWGGYRLRFINP